MILQYLLNTFLTVLLIYGLVCLVYYLVQEKFLFVPVHTEDLKFRKVKLPFEDLYYETPNNGYIHAQLFRANYSKGLIFYLHGNTGNLKRWRFMAEDLCKLGYDVFVMDYRGFGESRGKRSEAFMHRDVEFCFDAIAKNYQYVVIYGRSLGSGFATRLTSKRSANKVVLETPFNNMVDTAKYYLPFLPVPLFLRYRFRSDIYIKQIKCPIHIFHGTADIIVPYPLANKLFQIAKDSGAQVQMTTIKKGMHSNLNKYALFRNRLEKFLRPD